MGVEAGGEDCGRPEEDDPLFRRDGSPTLIQDTVQKSEDVRCRSSNTIHDGAVAAPYYAEESEASNMRPGKENMSAAHLP